MRHLATICIIAVLFGLGAGSARANCMVIDRIDKLHAIQSRLARGPDTGLFATDIRQLRAIMRGLSNRAALDAVDGNVIAGRGADILRMLRQTQQMLVGASLDDPATVQNHFTADVRRTLSKVGDHLHDLRCTSEQVSIDQARAAQAVAAGDSDAEDLAQVMRTLAALGQEAMRPRSIGGFTLTIIAIIVLTPVVRRWITLRRRRAMRRPANYPTSYRHHDLSIDGSLIDINCFGTKLARTGDHLLDCGDRIEIAIHEDWVPGIVIWSNRHYSGVRFARRIRLVDVEGVVASSDTG